MAKDYRLGMELRQVMRPEGRPEQQQRMVLAPQAVIGTIENLIIETMASKQLEPTEGNILMVAKKNRIEKNEFSIGTVYSGLKRRYGNL